MVTEREHAIRLREMMVQWWAGWSSGRIAKAHGLSQQRAHQILLNVGCTARVRRELQAGGSSSDERHPNRNEVIEAQVMMESSAWPLLTVRQRAVVAWLASGFGMLAIAARIGGTPQSVRNLFIAARWKVMGQQNQTGVAEAGAGSVGDLDVSVNDVPLEMPANVEAVSGEPQAPPSAPLPSPPTEAQPEREEPRDSDIAPQVEFDEPGEDKAETNMSGDAGRGMPGSIAADVPLSPPEISERDFPPGPVEKRPLRLSDIQWQKKPKTGQWTLVWSSRDGPFMG